MKLQTKLLLVLLGGVFSIYGVSCVVLHYVNEYQLKRHGREFMASEETEQLKWVGKLEQSVQSPLLDAMAEGDMDKFGRILASLRAVEGLQEVSLHDEKGRVAYSSSRDRQKSSLPEELKNELLATTKTIKRRTANSIELYRPIPAQKSCMECHDGWQEQRVCGVMSMKFSSDALNAAQSSWNSFEHDLSISNNVASGLTAAVLVAALAALIGATVHFQLVRPLRKMAAALDDQAQQVGNTARQMSDCSQSVAERASEQAASLEEVSASLEQMSSISNLNAEHARQSKEIASETRIAAEKGVMGMRDLGSAMQAIGVASDDITKIIKTIDKIAFQTNILALNAAVEAARAGEAGAGFAVVADEVRALAQRSAFAAQETTSKVTASLASSARGSDSESRIAAVLNDIAERARKLDDLAASVAVASKEQGQGVIQLNAAVRQMDQVTQGNAASAEESAAAAEELKARAETMKDAVDVLLNLIGKENQTAGINLTASKATSGGGRPKMKLSPAKQNCGKRRVVADLAMASNENQPESIP